MPRIKQHNGFDSPAEAEFDRLWRAFAPGYPLAHDEKSIRLPYAYSGRRFKSDFVHVESKVAIEIQGGAWSRGKHGRGCGIKIDTLKLMAAQRNGWQVYQVIPGAERQYMPSIVGAIADRGGKPVPVTQVPSIDYSKLLGDNPW